MRAPPSRRAGAHLALKRAKWDLKRFDAGMENGDVRADLEDAIADEDKAYQKALARLKTCARRWAPGAWTSWDRCLARRRVGWTRAASTPLSLDTWPTSMLAVDTNVLLRLLVRDDEEQERKARASIQAALEAGVRVLVPDVVLAEIEWVLRSGYGYGRTAIADAFEHLLATPPFAFQDAGVVAEAVTAYRDGPADLSDYLVVAGAVARGASEVLTFDAALAPHPSCGQPA